MSTQPALTPSDAQALALAKKMCNEGIDLDEIGQFSAAIAKYDEVITQFGSYRRVQFTEVVAKAMFNNGCAWAQLAQSKSAIAAFDALIKRFTKSEHLPITLFVVKAMMNKAYHYQRLERSTQSIATYEGLVTQYASHLEPAVQEIVGIVKQFLTAITLEQQSKSPSR
jgi:outer membrane protein assembly factor BamD (BamD/ComL family)